MTVDDVRGREDNFFTNPKLKSISCTRLAGLTYEARLGAGHVVSQARLSLWLLSSTPCRREVLAFPEEVRGDLADAVARLDEDRTLTMPLSRPMPGIGSGVHELRLKDRSGAYVSSMRL
jgi:hypothetical protein